MTLMQDAAAWLGSQLKVAAGRSVTIQQGARTLSNVTATVTALEYEVIDEAGFATKVLSYDWTFTAEDLGSLVFREGDTITETLNGVEEKYEAMPLGKKQCVERLDTSGVLLVVHSKRLKVC